MQPRHATSIAIASIAVASSAVSAATLTWDGGGDSTNGGSFNTNTNWSSDTTPGTSASTPDIATISSAAANRIITVDASVTNVQRINLNQNAGNVLTLRLNSSITLSGQPSTTSLVYGGTGDASSVVLGFNGGGLTFNDGSAGPIAIGRTVTFNAPGPLPTGDTSATGVTLRATGGNYEQNITFSGVVNVNANAGIARSNAGGVPRSVNVAFLAGSTLNVTDGDLNIADAVRKHASNAHPDATLDLAGAATIAQGRTLSLTHHRNGGTETRSANAAINQSGSLSQAGTIAMQARFNGTNSFMNSGTHAIAGAEARIVELFRANWASSAGSNGDTTYTNTVAGVVRGSGALDRLTYDSGNLATERLTLANNGAIRPGNGNGNVGTLELADINLSLAAASKLQIDIAGSAVGAADVLALVNGNSGAAGALTLADDALLDLNFVGGYVPQVNVPIAFLTYASQTGGTETSGFTVNSITGASGFAADPANWRVDYNATSATVTLVPEPAMLSALSLAALPLVRRRRA